MNYLDDPNILDKILTYVCLYVNTCQDIFSLRLVSSKFNLLVPKYIIKLIKITQQDINIDQISDFKKLIYTNRLNLILSSPHQIHFLPLSYRKGILSVFDFPTLIQLIEYNFDYLRLNYYLLDGIIPIIIRNNRWYIKKDHHRLLNFDFLEDNRENKEIREVIKNKIFYYEDFSPEYLFLVKSQDPSIPEINYVFNFYICSLDESVCSLLNLTSGPHQYGNVDLALYIFCQKHPPSTLTCIQRVILMKEFIFTRADRYPIIQKLLGGDLLIEDLNEFVREENLLFESLSSKIDLVQYIKDIS